MSTDRPPITKCVTFRAGSIGDSLMGKHFLKNVHEAYPHARCFMIVPTRAAMVRDVLAAYPWITILELNRRRPWRLLWALWVLRGSDLTTTPTAMGQFPAASKVFAKLFTKKGGLIGFEDGAPINEKVYSTVLPADKEKAVFLHEHDVLHAYGMEVHLQLPSYEILENDGVLDACGVEAHAYIVLHLYAGSTARGLAPDQKQAYITALGAHAAALGMQVVLTGGTKDAEELATYTLPENVTIVAGSVSVKDTANLLRCAYAVVSVDTGIAHMASGLGKKLVVIVSHRARNWWKPEQYDGELVTVLTASPGKDESPSTPYPQSMNAVAVADVVAALQ